MIRPFGNFLAEKQDDEPLDDDEIQTVKEMHQDALDTSKQVCEDLYTKFPNDVQKLIYKSNDQIAAEVGIWRAGYCLVVNFPGQFFPWFKWDVLFDISIDQYHGIMTITAKIGTKHKSFTYIDIERSILNRAKPEEVHKTIDKLDDIWEQIDSLVKRKNLDAIFIEEVNLAFHILKEPHKHNELQNKIRSKIAMLSSSRYKELIARAETETFEGKPFSLVMPPSAFDTSELSLPDED